MYKYIVLLLLVGSITACTPRRYVIDFTMTYKTNYGPDSAYSSSELQRIDFHGRGKWKVAIQEDDSTGVGTLTLYKL